MQHITQEMSEKEIRALIVKKHLGILVTKLIDLLNLYWQLELSKSTIFDDTWVIRFRYVNRKINKHILFEFCELEENILEGGEKWVDFAFRQCEDKFRHCLNQL
jgi:hypothetical protein